MPTSGNTYAVTIGGIAYPVYSDLDTTNDYLAGDFEASAWRAEADNDQKGRAIVSGARLIDSMQFIGEKTDPDQLNQFPRTGMGLSDISDDEIPQEVIDANALLAKYIHAGTIKLGATTIASGIKRQKAGSVEVEYFSPVMLGDPTRLPQDVLDLLRRFLGGDTVYAGSIATGVDCPSGFRPDFGVSGP